jgi:polar amino acid transport system substrate-binding protein
MWGNMFFNAALSRACQARFVSVPVLLRLCLILFTVAVLNLAAGLSMAEDVTTIKIATEEYPPYTSEKLPHFGIDAHIVTEVFRGVGIEVVFEFMPGARAINAAKVGNLDASLPWAHRAEREISFFYPDPVIAVDDEFFFHKAEFRFSWNPEIPDYKVLAGKTVAAIIGYDYGTDFQTAEKSGLINVARVRNLESAFKMLDHDRVNLVISKERVAQYELSKLFPDATKSKFSRTREHHAPMSFDYLIISRKSAHGSFFMKAFNQGMKKLKASGRYAEILRDFSDGKYVTGKN